MKPVKDPELIKQLEGSKPVSDPAILAQLEGKKAEGSWIDPVMQSVYWGWDDELAGIGARLGGALAGAGPERRDQLAAAETQRQRDQLQAYRDENPWSSLGLEVAGSLVSGVPVAKLAKTGLGLAGLGIGSGAVAGAGAADENKVTGGILGGTLGGLLAGALPAAGYLARKGGNMVADHVRPIWQRMTEEPTTRAGRILGDYLGDAGITPTTLNARMRQLGPDATLAEAAGDAGVTLGQGLVGRDPGARLAASKAFGARIPGMSDRVRGAVAKSTGVTNRLQPSLDAVKKRQKEISEPLYEMAYQQEIPLTGKLKSILSRPPMRDAFREAKEAAETVGDELPPWFKMNDLGEWEKVGSLPDMRAWDRMKQGIDRLINNETDSLTGKMTPRGRDLSILKSQLLSELDDIAPDYKSARAAFAGDAAIEQAMRSGENFMGMKTRQVHEAVKSMSPSEKEAFLTGAVEAIREKIGRARSGEIGSFKFLETDNVMEKLRAVFPPGKEGTRALAQLSREIRKERILKETDTAILRGSQTQLRDAASKALGEDVAIPTTAEALDAPIRTGITGAMSKIGQTLSRERQPTIDELSRMLFSPGGTQQAMIELQKRGIPPQLIQQYMNRFSVGSAALAPAGGLLGGNMAR